jgi:hypothetical protein
MIPQLASALAVVLGLDLLVTRVLLRLAIFVPKDPAVAGAVELAARAGALVETLAVLFALTLIVLLVMEPDGSPIRRLGLACAAAVGASGLMLLAVPISPAGLLVIEGAVLGAAVCLGTAVAMAAGQTPLRLGVIALAAALALAALSRMTSGLGAIGEVQWSGALGSGLATAGAAGYLAGGLILASAGFRARGPARHWVPWAVAGVLVALGLGGLFLIAPRTGGQLLIWSLGLQPILPLPVLALLAGLIVAGVGMLQGRATGPAMILLAGYGLTASYLGLAGLLGLALTARGLQAQASPGVRPFRPFAPGADPPTVTVRSSAPRTSLTS